MSPPPCSTAAAADVAVAAKLRKAAAVLPRQESCSTIPAAPGNLSEAATKAATEAAAEAAATEVAAQSQAPARMSAWGGGAPSDEGTGAASADNRQAELSEIKAAANKTAEKPPAFVVNVELCGGLEQLTASKVRILTLCFFEEPLDDNEVVAAVAAPVEEHMSFPLYQIVGFLAAYIISDRVDMFAEIFEPQGAAAVAAAAAWRRNVAASPDFKGEQQQWQKAGKFNIKNSSNCSSYPIGSLKKTGAVLPMRVRPGILALINENDAEIMGGMEAPVFSGDCITFISTLHGG